MLGPGGSTTLMVASLGCVAFKAAQPASVAIITGALAVRAAVMQAGHTMLDRRCQNKHLRDTGAALEQHLPKAL